MACAYSGVTLTPGRYQTCVWSAGGNAFFAEERSYFENGGPASASGIVNGPLTSPNVAMATSPGNSTYQLGASFPYPATFDSSDFGENRWVDVEVTPAAGPPSAGSGTILSFLP